jgi:AcrR family transcriptional regulator
VGTSERRARHRESLRQEILDAASRLFVEEGYQRVTMRRLAQAIEYSPTTIYLYFRDKAELLGAICEATFASLTNQLLQNEARGGSPAARLRSALRTYINFGLAHPHHYSVTFLTPTPTADFSAFEHSAGGRAFNILRQSVRACMDSGDVPPHDVDTTAQALWAAIHGTTALLITMPAFPFVARDTLIEHQLDLLMAGLRAGQAPQSAPKPARRFNFID